jgi:endonuclease YncB( thermonuclease family)
MSSILCFLFLIFFSFLVNATNYQKGFVKKIIDGDTIHVVTKHGNIKVRLECVDAPESNFYGNAQYYNGINIGDLPKKYLEEILFEKQIFFLCDGKSYNRKVCEVLYENQNVSNMIIQNGYGYVDKKYCTQEQIQMQEKAISKKIGLWKLGKWENPHVFRNTIKYQ